MKKTSRRRSTGTKYAVLDQLINLLVVFLVMSMPVSNTTNPPAPKTDTVLMVQLEWPLNFDCDVDLWVESPGDKPVGYSRSHGLYFDLVRDDLGRSQDPLSRNMEMAISRGAPAGNYTINAMMYSSHDEQFPVTVTATVNYGYHDTIAQASGKLEGDRQEITLVRFTLDKDGHVSNMNHVYKPLFLPPSPGGQD